MRICFFGESYVNGYGDPDGGGWVGRLCAATRAKGQDITAYNCGIRGATSDIINATWLREAEPRLTGFKDAAVVFSFGTNDSWLAGGQPQVPFDRQMSNTRHIVAAASHRWPTLMVGPPKLADDVRNTIRNVSHAARCQAMADICAELKVPFFDTFGASAGFKHWFTEATAGDGAHPGAKGYDELAAAVETWSAWREFLERLRS